MTTNLFHDWQKTLTFLRHWNAILSYRKGSATRQDDLQKHVRGLGGGEPALKAASLTAWKPGMSGPLVGSMMQSESIALPTCSASPSKIPATCIHGIGIPFGISTTKCEIQGSVCNVECLKSSTWVAFHVLSCRQISLQCTVPTLSFYLVYTHQICWSRALHGPGHSRRDSSLWML